MTEIIYPILLGITGFLLIKFYNVVDDLKKVVDLMRIELSGKNAACTEKHISINGRLKQHDSDIRDLSGKFEEHDKDIAILKNK